MYAKPPRRLRVTKNFFFFKNDEVDFKPLPQRRTTQHTGEFTLTASLTPGDMC